MAQQVERINVVPKSTPEAGTGLFAARQIKLNEAILSVNQPLMLALDTPRLNDTCYCCLLFLERSGSIKRNDKVETKTLKACTGCKVVRYCDKDCQKSSWTSCHRLECKIFAKLHPNVLPNNVRAIVRLLLLQKVKLLPHDEWDQLMALEAHIDKLRKAGGERWQNLCLMTKAAKEYSSSTLDEDTILGLFCRLMINSFTLVTPTYDPLGLVLHPLPALLNHSCDYNATIRISGAPHYHQIHSKIEVIPLRPIEKGEEILISYIDANLPYANRQEELRQRYFFTCQCPKCLKDSMVPEDGFLDGSAQLDLDGVRELEGRAEELLKSAASDTSLTGPVQKLKYALYLIQKTGVWPLHRHPSPALRHQLILAYLDASQFNLAYAHAAVQHFRIDPELMPQSHHPIRMVHDWVFVCLMDHVLDPQKDEWASQKWDLVSYKIDISFWRSYVIHDLYKSAQKVPYSQFTTNTLCSRHEQIWHRHHGYPGELESNNKERYEKEYALMEKMMDDVLEADEAWQAAS